MVVAAAWVLGCTPVAQSLELEEAARLADGIHVVPFAEAPAFEPAPYVKLSRLTPPPPPTVRTAPEYETLDLYVGIADTEHDACEVVVEAPGFPAYDSDRGRVVALHRFRPQMTYDLGTLDLVWLDATTGAVVERIEVVRGGYAEPGDCALARRFTERGLAKARRRLEKATYEAMPAVPIEWISYADMVLPGLREERAAALAAGEGWDEAVPEHVEAFEFGGELIVRMRGIAVLERGQPVTWSDGTTLDAVHAHRETGVVLFTEIDCAGDSCTCDPATVHTVDHWQPSTLARIDQNPCTLWDDGCGVGSVFADM